MAEEIIAGVPVATQPSDTLSSLIAARLRIRETNPDLFERLEQAYPLVTRNVNTAAQVQGQATPGQVQQVASQVSRTESPSGQLLNTITSLLNQTVGDKAAKDILSQASGIMPPKPIGPDLFGRGGIMGTGLEPIDVLAFALGGLLTSNLPQDKALATTFEIAKLPSAFRQNQRKAAEQFIQNALSAVQLSQHETQLRQSQTELFSKNARQAVVQGVQEKIIAKQPLTPDDLLLMAVHGVGGLSMDELLDIKQGNIHYDSQRGVVVNLKTGTATPVVGPDGKVLGEREPQGMNQYDARALQLFNKRYADLTTAERSVVMTAVDRAANQRIALQFTGQQFNMENALLDDFRKDTEAFKDLQNMFNRLKVARKDTTGASDIAFVFGYMKMLDRLSVVREGEQEQMRKLASLREQAQIWYNNLTSGKVRVLPSSVRNDIFNIASGFMAEERKHAKTLTQTYQQRAKRWSVNPELFRLPGGEGEETGARATAPEPPPGFSRPKAIEGEY